MKIRNSLGSFYSTLGGGGLSQSLPSNVGRVFHIISNAKSAGYTDDSDIGKVYILKNDAAKPILNLIDSKVTKDDLESAGLKLVLPLLPNITYIPVLDELILLFELPSYDSGAIANKTQIYYLSPINLYNNYHHNSQGIYNVVDPQNNEIKLGNYIQESSTLQNLLPFEGDFILNSRWGSGIRFSSTFKFDVESPANPWSYGGKVGDPITMLVNGYGSKDKEDISKEDLYLENINNDGSSIYLTSTQTLTNFEPKLTISEMPGSFGKLTAPHVYNKSQIIQSANRIVLNSNKNDIIMYGATNIELGANNTIHLNGQQQIYLNAPKVYLGQIYNQSLDNNLNRNPQPVLLGTDTQLFLSNLLLILNKFTSDLTLLSKRNPKYAATSIATFAASAQQGLIRLRKDLKDILSESTFVSK
jgi:hypothetical protein